MSVIKGFKEENGCGHDFHICRLPMIYTIVALTPTWSFWFMAIAEAIMALCIPIANVSIQTIRQTVVPVKMLGRVNPVMMALTSAASPFGMILSTVIVEVTGAANLFLASAGSAILTSTLSWFLTDIMHVEEMEKNTLKAQ